MLTQISDCVWSIEHRFRKNGIVVSSRMTVVVLPSNQLWVHSPIPIDEALRSSLSDIGKVTYAIAPSKTHNLFYHEFITQFPGCKKYVAPGLEGNSLWKGNVEVLDDSVVGPWHPHLEFVNFNGIPAGNETVWFHKDSSTLILTDLCQYWNGKLRLSAEIYARINGVKRRMAVPVLVRILVSDKQAAADSAMRILNWPIKRIIMGHNCIVEENAYEQLEESFAVFTR